MSLLERLYTEEPDPRVVASLSEVDFSTLQKQVEEQEPVMHKPADTHIPYIQAEEDCEGRELFS